jgi:hypothetical protein
VKTCSSCHASLPTKAGAAAKTHGDANVHASGLACTSCHQKHDFSLAAKGTAVCERCHSTEQHAASTLAGHAKCDGCHGDVHTPVRTPTCNACHAKEQSTAPKGHQACTSCHEPHDGKRKVACGSCHANEQASAHAKAPGSCNACHRPHGPNGVASPPACGSCHAPASLPGLHRVVPAAGGGHASCTTCHSSHGPTRADRATCTSCHQDKRDHQPEAKVCNGCHVFRR